MSCLFDSVAALVAARADLRARVERKCGNAAPTAAQLRAVACDALARVRVHDVPLAEWGALEAGTTPDAYAARMRDPREWGGGVELAALARLLRAPIAVRAANDAAVDATPLVVFGARYPALPLRLRFTGSHYTPD
jgi:hypothetical protein